MAELSELLANLRVREMLPREARNLYKNRERIDAALEKAIAEQRTREIKWVAVELISTGREIRLMGILLQLSTEDQRYVLASYGNLNAEEIDEVRPLIEKLRAQDVLVAALAHASPTYFVAPKQFKGFFRPGEPILIVHLSDLHFGAKSRFAGQDPRNLARAFNAGISEAVEQNGLEGPNRFVIVTGDVTETAKPAEYSIAAAFFKELAQGLGLPRRQVVFAPGNHDVSWPECKIAEAQAELEETFDPDRLRHNLDKVKLKHFHAFLRDFYEIDDLTEVAHRLASDALLFDYPEIWLSVAALNSAERESHRDGDHIGQLGPDQARSLMDAWLHESRRTWLKIVAIHHNPIATPPNNLGAWRDHLRSRLGGITEDLLDRYEADVIGFPGRDRLEAIVQDTSPQLVLFGHQHEPDEKPWSWRDDGFAFLLGAGSGGLRRDELPGDETNALRLIHLDVLHKKLKARNLIWSPKARPTGLVDRGAFVSDPADRSLERTLFLPPGFVADGPSSPAEPPRPDLKLFLNKVRVRLSGEYESYDLRYTGVPQPGGAVIDATLDEMYLPLRLGEGYHIDKLDQGAVLPPDELMQRDRPLVIRGAAGAGKTTWMRWTFRRLLRRDDALPLMVTLRDVARRWSQPECTGAERSLDWFLDCWLTEHLGSTQWEGCLDHLFEKLGSDSEQEDVPIPRPVLLVDGWDELGSLGEEVRTKLVGFLREHPQVLVVVTSRPYGEGRPSDSEGFEVLDVQPLSDEEIDTLTERFYSICYRNQPAVVERESRSFRGHLDASPPAKDLARTALLLTMMLMISRSEPLPDKRHLLYEACIKNLLNAIPKRKETEGVKWPYESWRPDDSEERFRVVAALAAEMQEQGYPKIKKWASQNVIVATQQELEGWLPDAWSEERRKGFLLWLSGPAGLLTDRTDGTYCFAHLSFQEYLSAWHFDATIEGDDERIKAFLERLPNEVWWETLLLWMAIINVQSQGRLEPVLRGLMSHCEDGIWLAGMAFADGLGREDTFAEWIELFLDQFTWRWPGGSERCLRAWASTRQDTRRQKLFDQMSRRAKRASWLEWNRLEMLVEKVKFPGTLPAPEDRLAAAIVAVQREESIRNEDVVAGGRILCGSDPLWPRQPAALSLLQLWPGHRKIASSRVQLATACEMPEEHLERTVRAWGSQPFIDAEKLALERDLARDFARDWAHKLTLRRSLYFSHGFSRDLARGWARDFVRDWACVLAPYWLRDLARRITCNFVRDFARDCARDWGRDWARDWGRDWTRDFARDFARYLARDWGIEQVPPWLEDFTRVDFFSFGRGAARAAAAMLKGGPPEALLMAEAARLSLHPDLDPAEFEEALAQYGPDLDPLWPALARHLARRSTEEDKALLIDLAQHPGKREPPLQWGLRYIVRGDVMLGRGEVVTLNELTDRAGVPRLPYLEDLPYELEIDWDKE